jgi:hypothetical protein
VVLAFFFFFFIFIFIFILFIIVFIFMSRLQHTLIHTRTHASIYTGFHRLIQRKVAASGQQQQQWSEEFRHPKFLRGRKDLLLKVTRRNRAGSPNDAEDVHSSDEHASSVSSLSTRSAASNDNSAASGSCSEQEMMDHCSLMETMVEKMETRCEVLETELACLQEQLSALERNTAATRDKSRALTRSLSVVLALLVDSFASPAAHLLLQEAPIAMSDSASDVSYTPEDAASEQL